MQKLLASNMRQNEHPFSPVKLNGEWVTNIHSKFLSNYNGFVGRELNLIIVPAYRYAKVTGEYTGE
jgi:hypothetical protein